MIARYFFYHIIIIRINDRDGVDNSDIYGPQARERPI